MTVRELLDSAVPRLYRELDEEPEVKADLLSVMGRAYGALGFREDARPLFDSAVSLRRRTGSDALDLLRDQTHLAFYLRMDGDQAGAESLYQTSLATARRRFGPRHPNLTFPLVEFGNMWRQHGRWAEAESRLKRCCARRWRFGPTRSGPSTR
ncbi:MAG: tetratricopeptide repeat protein [Gemmatimonadales bacterium]